MRSTIVSNTITLISEETSYKSVPLLSKDKLSSNSGSLIGLYLQFNETLNLILLDKFHGKSNISLVLIQLKCEIERALNEFSLANVADFTLDNPNFQVKKLKDLIKNQHSGLLYVFKRAHYWDIHEIKEVYEHVFDGLPYSLKPTEKEIVPFVHDGLDDHDLVLKSPISVHGSSEFSWGISETYIENCELKILCCSDSLDAFLEFNQPAETSLSAHIIDHHKLSTINHLMKRTFMSSSKLKINHDDRRSKVTTNEHIPKITEKNIGIVNSIEFQDFHLKRITVLGLKDKKIF